MRDDGRIEGGEGGGTIEEGRKEFKVKVNKGTSVSQDPLPASATTDDRGMRVLGRKSLILNTVRCDLLTSDD